jgi:hypothetical protein
LDFVPVFTLTTYRISKVFFFWIEHHWRYINCRNAHLVHQNAYRMNFIHVCKNCFPYCYYYYPIIIPLPSFFKNVCGLLDAALIRSLGSCNYCLRLFIVTCSSQSILSFTGKLP